MKKIGMIGGLGPESTMYYYRLIIDLSRENKDLAGAVPEIIIYSVDHEEIIHLIRSGHSLECTAKLAEVVQSLHKAGADFGLFACNGIHILFDDIKIKSPIPLLSIVEETCNEATKLRLKKVGLIGVEITMKSHFYHDVFGTRNISIITPREKEMAYVSGKIRTELAFGIIRDETRKECLKFIKRMKDEESIEGMVLGCTELPLLFTEGNEKELGIPLLNTSKIHVQSALRYCLSGT